LKPWVKLPVMSVETAAPFFAGNGVKVRRDQEEIG
jgi:hypothetical protein